MRWLTLVLAVNALLQPRVLRAQCEGEDWYATTTTIAPTVPSLASTSPIILVSEYDSALITIQLIQGNGQNDVEFQLNGVSHLTNSCWPGRVFIIQKHSYEGELEWYRTGCFSNDGLINGMTIDDSGNLYFGGYFNGDLIYNGGTQSQSPTNIWSHFTLKIDMDGAAVWQRSGLRSTATGHTWTDQGMLVFLAVTDSTTFDGQSFYHQGNSTNTEYVVLMVNSEGEVLWNRHIGGIGNKFIREVSFGNGICVAQGFYMDSLVYGGLQLGGGQGRMFQLAFSSSNGDGLWVKRQTNTGTSVFTYSSEILDDASLVTVGNYFGNPSVFSFQGQSITSANGLTDGFLMRQDLNTGDLTWLKTLGAPGYSTVFGVAKTHSGVVITGEFSSASLSYEGIQLTNHSELQDPFIIVVDSLGKPTCHFQDLGSQTPESGNNILTFGNDIYWLLGFNGSAHFEGNDVVSSGNTDRLVWKTCLPCDRISGISEDFPDRTRILLESDPNPFSDYTDVQYEHDGCTDCQIIITDVSGRIIKRIRTEGTKGTVRVYSSEIGSGMFIYSLVKDGKTVSSDRLISSNR